MQVLLAVSQASKTMEMAGSRFRYTSAGIHSNSGADRCYAGNRIRRHHANEAMLIFVSNWQ